jgi:hypothetical protein
MSSNGNRRIGVVRCAICDGVYASPRWQVARQRAVARDGNTCAVCGVNDAQLDVHHVRPVHRGGVPFDLHNLVALCRPCHAAVEALVRAIPVEDDDVEVHHWSATESLPASRRWTSASDEDVAIALTAALEKLERAEELRMRGVPLWAIAGCCDYPSTDDARWCLEVALDDREFVARSFSRPDAVATARRILAAPPADPPASMADVLPASAVAAADPFQEALARVRRRGGLAY